MQIIAFDYGEKKIGVAVGQTSTNTSSPLQIIFNKDNKINWVSISSLLDEWKPDLILLGKPLNMDGSESEIMKKVDKFYKQLKSIYDADIEFVDERLTTFEAREILKDEKQDNVDAHAAKILIDNWFDINKEKNI
jgi:putative Holliday junction resolvase